MITSKVHPPSLQGPFHHSMTQSFFLVSDFVCLFIAFPALAMKVVSQNERLPILPLRGSIRIVLFHNEVYASINVGCWALDLPVLPDQLPTLHVGAVKFLQASDSEIAGSPCSTAEGQSRFIKQAGLSVAMMPEQEASHSSTLARPVIPRQQTTPRQQISD